MTDIEFKVNTYYKASRDFDGEYLIYISNEGWKVVMIKGFNGISKWEKRINGYRPINELQDIIKSYKYKIEEIDELDNDMLLELL